MRTSLQWVMIIISVMLLSACGLTKPVKLPALSVYTLGSITPVKHASKTTTGKTILVGTPVADPGYRATKMIYIQIPFKLRAYASHQWIAPPAQMLLPLLAQAVRNTRYFHAVVTPPFSGVAQYHLVTQLIRLQQEFLRPVSRIDLVMDAELINSATNQVVASRRFQVYMNAPQNDPYSGVLAAHRAAKQVVKQIARFVVRSL